jgi:hypothetical protein
MKHKLKTLVVAVSLAVTALLIVNYRAMPSPDAMVAAEVMLQLSQSVASTPGALRPTAVDALRSFPGVKKLAPEVEIEIADMAIKETVAELHDDYRDLIKVYATEMTIDDLRAVAVFFASDHFKTFLAAQANAPTVFRSPQPQPEAARQAGQRITEFFASEPGRNYLHVRARNIVAFQRAAQQGKIRFTTTLNNALRTELKRRGLVG